MESALADALIGQVLDGRYHVRSRIAHGGMATVYLATDTRLDRQVAVKVMHAELARDEDFVTRFIGEAKSVARLSHPNIVAVFDQGSDGQYLYLAMEYVPGRTLRSLLRERGRMDAEPALGIIDPILSGLAAAHASGIVHRDVKPENVLLTADGRLKVVDFGLARAQAASGQTRAGLVIGTVGYIAPEQVTGQVTDFRTDVYAAGVLLFELLTGRQPYTGDSPLSVAYMHVNSDVPAPSSWVAGVPPVVDRLVLAATSRDPRLRPADAGEFLQAVRAVRAGADPVPFLGSAPPPDGRLRAGENQTMVVPGGYGPGRPYAAEMGYPDNRRYPGDRLYAGGHAEVAYESSLVRWLFSRRAAYAAAGAIALLLVIFAAWYLTSGRYTPLPSVAGLAEPQAAAMLRSDGFKVQVGKSVHSDTVPAGDVVSTSPSGRATSGATIVLTVSSGPRMVTIPAVIGHSLAEAKALLRQAGLTVSDQPRNVGATGVPIGTVQGTIPAAGTSWPRDKPVTVVVVAGPPVPNLVGQDAQSIQQNWAQPNGVNLVTQTVPSDQPAGTIVAQSPSPGTVLTQGESVTVSVSAGPGNSQGSQGSSSQAPGQVPNVAGEKIDQAKQDLQNAGFKVHAVRIGFGDRVVYFNPSGQAPQGSTITVYFGF